MLGIVLALVQPLLHVFSGLLKIVISKAKKKGLVRPKFLMLFWKVAVHHGSSAALKQLEYDSVEET